MIAKREKEREREREREVIENERDAESRMSKFIANARERKKKERVGRCIVIGRTKCH